MKIVNCFNLKKLYTSTVDQIKLRKKLLKVSNKVAEDYRATVKGNYRMEKLLIRKKLTRNVMMTEPVKEMKDGTIIHEYGNLTIGVNDGKVIYLKNVKGNAKRNFKKDYELYARLNEELQIKEN